MNLHRRLTRSEVVIVLAAAAAVVLSYGYYVSYTATGATLRAWEQGACPDGYVQAPSTGTVGGKVVIVSSCVPRIEGAR